VKYAIAMFLVVYGCRPETSEERPGYEPLSASVIKVSLLSNSADTLYLEALTMNNIPREGSESDLVSAVLNGDYYLTLTNDRPNSAFLILNDAKYNVIVFPKDTVTVNINQDKRGNHLTFDGRGADINEYYEVKRRKFGYTDSRVPNSRYITSSGSYESVRQGSEAIMNKELGFLKTYVTKHELPRWFVQFEEAEIKYLAYGIIVQMPKYNETSSLFHDVLPAQYFSFADQDLVNNPSAILSSHYFWFLDDYFIVDLPANEFENLSWFEKTKKIQSHILNRSKTELSGEVKDLYHKYMFSSIISFISDSLAIDSLAKTYEVSDYKILLAGAGTRPQGRLSGLDLVQGDTIPDFNAVDVNDSLVSLSDYEDKVLYVSFWATWCGPCIQNIPNLNKMIGSYADRDDIRFLNICIDSDKAKWLAAIERYKLKGNNLFTEGRWNEKLRAIFNMKAIPNYALIERGNILFENHTDKAPEAKRSIDKLLRQR
jgi:thiol-disulfide isomerase/thioredoxin